MGERPPLSSYLSDEDSLLSPLFVGTTQLVRGAFGVHEGLP